MAIPAQHESLTKKKKLPPVMAIDSSLASPAIALNMAMPLQMYLQITGKLLVKPLYT